jgi:hypothetical protein
MPARIDAGHTRRLTRQDADLWALRQGKGNVLSTSQSSRDDGRPPPTAKQGRRTDNPKVC